MAAPEPPHDPSDAVRSIELLRHVERSSARARDLVAAEEPLEIRVQGTPIAVLMRTPGDDGELVRGFLLSERIVGDPGDIAAVRPCPVVADPDAEDNVINVTLRAGLRVDLEALRRNLYASASCGVCGKATIANALAVAPPLDDPLRVAPAALHALAAQLARGQTAFARTGGLHAAGLFAPDGTLLVVREDIGRHNAVDKTIGWALEQGRLPLSGHGLMVSGRISFEIAQKALAVRVPVIAAVSAPSSLAVELAESAGMTLIGFLRDHRFNVYGRMDRVTDDCRPRTNE